MALVLTVGASSCIGTLGSRVAEGHFGSPFYSATSNDCLWVSGHNRMLTHDSGFIGEVPLVVYVAFLSVPFDAVIDTVLLPVDAVVSLLGSGEEDS